MSYVCGDPAQLPPVSKDEDNHLLDKPHIFLDEIMRQAEESEIIQLTMKIRAQEKIQKQKGEEVQVYSKNELTDGMLTWANQVLCATNKTRQDLNIHMRQLQGRGDNPEIGDKIICLKNEWERESDCGNPLINGTIGYITNIKSEDIYVPFYLKLPIKFFRIFTIDFETETGEKFFNIPIDRNMLLFGEPTLDFKTAYILSRTKIKNKLPIEFAFGYAITTHKAQRK